MDNQAIEQTAIHAVQDRVNLTDYLSSYLNSNDKTPSWDGYIYIYNNQNKSKDNIIGRIPAQIKGHEEKNMNAETIPYSIEVAHLKNYLNDGGAILFVVYVAPNEEHTDFIKKIFYLELTPTKLSWIISGCSLVQKQVTLHLATLPNNPNDFASFVLNCYLNCKKQASFAGSQLPTAPELEEQGILESLEFYVSGFGEEYKTPRGFLKVDTPLYARIKGLSIPQPLKYEGEMVDKILAYNVNCKVSSGGTEYFDRYRVVVSSDNNVIHLGYGITLSFSSKGGNLKFNYTSPHMMREFVHDAPFMIAFLTNKSFTINTTVFDFSRESTKLELLDIDALKQDYSRLSRYVEMFNAQNCMDDIDYTILNQEDWRNLEMLSQATLEGKSVCGLHDGLDPLVTLHVEHLQFAVALTPIPNERGTYTLCHFQDGSPSLVYAPPDESEAFPVPVCAALNSENFASISNIRFSQILPEIQSMPVNSHTYGIANQIMLSMIIASDQVIGKRKLLLLETALKVADWLSSLPEDVWDRDISTLNRLQILSRQRKLSEEERGLLYAMVLAKDKREDILFGAYVLLGKKEEAFSHFYSLPESAQDELKQFPIYNLIK